MKEMMSIAKGVVVIRRRMMKRQVEKKRSRDQMLFTKGFSALLGYKSRSRTTRV